VQNKLILLFRHILESETFGKLSMLTANIIIGYGLPTACTIGRGCGKDICYPVTVVCDKAIFREANDNLQVTRISVGGHIFSTMRYADDQAVVANSQSEWLVGWL